MLRLNKSPEMPKFVQLITSCNGVYGGKVPEIKSVIEDVFNVAVKQGLNDEEFSLLLRLFCKGTNNFNDKIKLLQNLVPSKKAPARAIRQFMAWFVLNYKRSNRVSTWSRILQWLIGLLEHNLVDPEEINNFYFEFYSMLEVRSLVPCAGKLLCKLSKPYDVTSSTVMTVLNCFQDSNDKYLLAILNVFQGFKPHLVPTDLKKVDVQQVLCSVPQTMDSVMKVRAIGMQVALPFKGKGIVEIPMKNFSYFKEDLNKISSIITLPTYNLEGLDQYGVCFPSSIEQASRMFARVPVPQNIISLLRNDVGLFITTYYGIELQMRFANCLLQTLQNVMIHENVKASEDDKEDLLNRVYCLQTFMRQAVPGVSVFLSGYLVTWDGLDHRHAILNLIKWSTFHSFKDLATNILAPLHMLFVSSNVTMKKAIMQAVISLITNMFSDVKRSQHGIQFPFTKRGPRWTEDPVTTLSSLVHWAEDLIKLGLCLEQYSVTLLLQAIHFYEVINRLEQTSWLPMFTVLSEGVVLRSLLSISPNPVITICRLLLRYHKVFLPHVRLEKPQFYKEFRKQIVLTSNYTQQILCYLQSGQVLLPRKENGVIVREVAEESLLAGGESLNLSCNIDFVPYVMFESTKNHLNLSLPEHSNHCFELSAAHLKEIMEFITYFSPAGIPEVL